MLSIESESVVSGPSINSLSFLGWLYLNFELLLGLALSGFLVFLSIIKSSLPKPPRDLTGNVVLVTGATSSLGCSLAEEFVRAGCSVILVDGAGSGVEELADGLKARYPGVEWLAHQHPKEDAPFVKPSALAYTCDVWDREQVRDLVRKVTANVGSLDVLITCALSPESDLFDAVSRTLMSHYWTVLAFLPLMLHREKAHVIGVTPTKSTAEAFMGTKAAIAGLMNSLTQQLNGRNNRLIFMTVAPYAEPSLMQQSEQDIARKMVQSVRRDQSSLSMNWISKLIYYFGSRLYNGITTITNWFDT